MRIHNPPLFALTTFLVCACGDANQIQESQENTSTESAASTAEAQENTKPDAAIAQEQAFPTQAAAEGDESADGAPTPEELLEQLENPEAFEELKPDPNLPVSKAPVYDTSAKSLLNALKEDIPAETIEAMASDLVVTGLGVLKALKPLHPDCKDYYTAIEDVALTLKDLPVSEIESGYHADGKLPKNTNAACYHVKDLIVHPATVAAMAKTEFKAPNSREKAVGEIAEVVQHYAEVAPKAATP